MAESIVKLLAGVIGLFAAWGIDALLGKWLAYFERAWEIAATKTAREAYNKAMADFAANSSDAFKGWEAWRKQKAQTSNSLKAIQKE